MARIPDSEVERLKKEVPNEAGKDRWQLGFKDAVLFGFGFLSTYGLRTVEEDATFVRYESDSVFVNVYHGRADETRGTA